MAGLSFIVIDSSDMVTCAGINQLTATSHTEASGAALLIAFSWAVSDASSIQKVFISDPGLWRVLQGFDNDINWRLDQMLHELRSLLLQLSIPQVSLIPRDCNRLAIEIAGKGFNVPFLSLFHQGLEKPRWLMNAVQKFGFFLP